MGNPWAGKATTGGGGNFEAPPAGAHPAVCVALVDLGTHDEDFKDKNTGLVTTRTVRKVYIAWELTGEKMAGYKDAQPRNFVVGRDYNVAYSAKAALRLMLEKWRGKQFNDGEEIDVSRVLGRECLVTITHGTSAKGNTFAKVDGVGPVPKGMTVPKPLLTPFSYRVEEGEPGLPDWLPYIYGRPVKDVIGESKEARGELVTPDGEQAEGGLEIPF